MIKAHASLPGRVRVLLAALSAIMALTLSQPSNAHAIEGANLAGRHIPPGYLTSMAQSENCIAWMSTAVNHNGWYLTLGGGDPAHGRRGTEIAWLQETCNQASAGAVTVSRR